MIWRRLPLVLTIGLLGVLISFYLIVSSPRIYEASAVIQLDMPAAIDPASDSSLPASRRVQLIEQRLMARQNLRDMIKRLKLFADTPGLSESQQLTALRRSCLPTTSCSSGAGSCRAGRTTAPAAWK